MMMKAAVALATLVAAEKFGSYPDASLVEQAEAAKEMQTAQGRADKEYAVEQALDAADMVEAGAEKLTEDPFLDEENESDDDSEIANMKDSERSFEKRMFALKKVDQQQSMRQMEQMQKAATLMNERPGELDSASKAQLLEAQESENKNLRSLGIKPTGQEFAGLL